MGFGPATVAVGESKVGRLGKRWAGGGVGGGGVVRVVGQAGSWVGVGAGCCLHMGTRPSLDLVTKCSHKGRDQSRSMRATEAERRFNTAVAWH